MATSSQLRAWWAQDLCKSGSMQTVTILGRKTPVNRRTTEAWDALSRVLEAKGYVGMNVDGYITGSSVWNYNCRKIGGSSAYSLHAYGLATDIDPKVNPFVGGGTQWSKTAFTKSMVDAGLAIKTKNGKQVFTWGGYWSSKQDYMHWQIDVQPNDLATGIDWDTVDAEPGPTSGWQLDSQESENMPLLPVQYGHGYNSPPADSGLTGSQKYKAEDVRHVQLLAGIDEADGVYGVGTAAQLAEVLGETDPVLVVDAGVYGGLLSFALGGQESELIDHYHRGGKTGPVIQ